MKIIVKPIIQEANGYWWAHSQVHPNRIYSLHTKDKAKAQALYDQHIANARSFVAPHDLPGDAGMDGVQERYRK
jgi:hypothetical protein